MVKESKITAVKIMICPNCNGHGHIIQTNDNVYGSDIVKKIQCKKCGGTGETIDESMD